jgi:YVTN family beta-propeller protein
MAKISALATFRVPGAPDWMAVTTDSVWVTSQPRDTITRLDGKTNTIAQVVNVKAPCSGLVFAFGSIWSPSCGGGVVVRFDAQTGIEQAKIPVKVAESESSIASGAGSVWLVTATPGPRLVRIDGQSNQIRAMIPLAEGSVACTFGSNAVWVTSPKRSIVSRVNASTNRVTAEIPVGQGPRFLTFGGDAVWTLNQGDRTITRIDPTSNKVVASITAGLQGKGGEITFGDGHVWLTLFGFPITKIAAATNKVVAQWVGPGGDSVRYGLGALWLTDLKRQKVWRLDPARLK